MKKLFLLFFLTWAWAPAFAGDEPFLTPEKLAPHAKTIARIETYLSGLSTIVADFTQVAPDGSLATGKFYLKRPGRMRWQYNPPTPILMVSDGSVLVFYDYEREQVSHIALESTLIGFLAEDKIRFADGVGILDFEERAEAIRITVAQRGKPDEGRLTLEFSDSPLLIRNMAVRDATGQTTTVALNHARFGQALDNELFVFKDPRERKRPL